jgi:predicted Rossmann fold nucleotide-binding protein DprA/Smf involved in DNA uptake
LVALHPTEVAEALPLRIKELLADRAANPATADTETSPTGNTGNTGWLLAALTRGKSYSAESLARLAGLELPRVQALLVELGIDGRLRRHPGALYSQRSSRAL